VRCGGQIYDSKKAYHNTVVALFQRRRPHNRVKTYALTYSFKTSELQVRWWLVTFGRPRSSRCLTRARLLCGSLQERKMQGNSAPLKFFSYMTPTARFKSIRIASESKKNVQVLYEKVKRFSGKR
jgi:hypothetical protein